MPTQSTINDVINTVKSNIQTMSSSTKTETETESIAGSHEKLSHLVRRQMLFDLLHGIMLFKHGKELPMLQRHCSELREAEMVRIVCPEIVHHLFYRHTCN